MKTSVTAAAVLGGCLLAGGLLAVAASGGLWAAQAAQVAQNMDAAVDMHDLPVRWSPYLVGGGIGVVSILAFLLSGRGLGASTSFMQTGGMLERKFLGVDVGRHEYYRENPPEISWQWMLVVGVLIGSFGSSLASGTFHFEWVPEMWRAAFGGGFLLRWAAALVGGALLGFGSRLAGGCTSGHGITGSLQLATSSWVAFLCFFAGGVIAAAMLY